MSKSIRCRNIIICTTNGKCSERRCGRFLVQFPDNLAKKIEEYLKNNPHEEMIVRCPSCKPPERFAKIHSVNGKLTYEACEENPVLGEEMEFEEDIITSQVA